MRGAVSFPDYFGKFDEMTLGDARDQLAGHRAMARDLFGDTPDTVTVP